MQRYYAGSCTRAVDNSTICGPSAQDTGRMGSSSLPTNFPVSSRSNNQLIILFRWPIWPVATVDDKSSIRWKFGEDELSAILYLMDVSDELLPAIKFLLWLLPKVSSSPNSTINSGRNVLMLQRNEDNKVCNVGEVILLSSLRRYENILCYSGSYS
ncbi:mediator of RNA polymerase II transcription subunit [Trifolium repens]|nr:mediator of RNA polymerase II transcription subunit [Trifolium repens]